MPPSAPSGLPNKKLTMAARGAARGNRETEQLRENIKDQLNRLLTQVEDLEELKDEFEPDGTAWRSTLRRDLSGTQLLLLWIYRIRRDQTGDT
jgi:hypothetical protein